MNENPTSNNKKEEDLPGYAPYPASEDIYMTDKRAEDIDPDDNSVIKTPVATNDEWDDVEEGDSLMLDDLDVPGSELDDDNEDIGEEDEENNYYSLGGDNHDE